MEVPVGATAGDTFTVTLPGPPAADEAPTVLVQVPAGARAGDQMTVSFDGACRSVSSGRC